MTLEPGFYRGGHSEVGEPDGFTIATCDVCGRSDDHQHSAAELGVLVEEVPFCDCTNEQLEHGHVCAQPHCPNREM